MMRRFTSFHPTSALLFASAFILGSYPAIALQTSDPSTAAPIAKLKSPAAQTAGYFGFDDSISGDSALVGASGENAAGVDCGAAYVFVLNSGAWTLQETFPPSSQTPYPLLNGDQFGVSVAIEGDTAVVGTYGDDNANGVDAGAAYVYVRSGGSWFPLPVLMAPAPVPPDVGTSDQFGREVAISGDTIVVGAYLDDVGTAVNAGSVYIFLRNDNGTPANPLDDFYSQVQQFSGSAGDQFGFAVAIDGPVLVVGAYLDDETFVDQGSATVFTLNMSGIWVPSMPKLVDPMGSASDQFGVAVAVHGNRVVVGAYGDDSPLTNAGSAHVFDRFGNSWGETARLVAPDPSVSDEFGRSLALDNQRIVVGANFDDYTGNADLGSFYVYEFNGSSWSPVEKRTSCDGAAPLDQQFSIAIALDGDLLIAGAHAYQVLGADDAGAAYVYRMTPGMQFSTSCYGDASGTACPCMNNTTAGRRQGCRNSNPGVIGAQLAPVGTDSAGADDLQIIGCSLVPSAPALLFSGPVQTAGVTFGDGLRCVEGPGIKRLGVRIPDSGGNAVWGPGLRVPGAWVSGNTRYFQVYYRNIVGPCSTGFNVSNSAVVTFTP